MINYFAEAEKTLRARGYLESALGNLTRRRERIISESAPSGYPSPDFSKPYASTSAVNDALSACVELAEVEREVALTKKTIAEVDTVLGQLEEADARLLRLWYIERKSKDEIAEEVVYTSASTIYDLRNKAVAQFALLYFGAGALASM
ncbi:MAG: DUF1492 domain-containing protein [Oscillospiraceae bacterium]|nr:DUF1492 domain-containing protein [Oscillospiraceae bacterium]